MYLTKFSLSLFILEGIKKTGQCVCVCVGHGGAEVVSPAPVNLVATPPQTPHKVCRPRPQYTHRSWEKGGLSRGGYDGVRTRTGGERQRRGKGDGLGWGGVSGERVQGCF